MRYFSIVICKQFANDYRGDYNMRKILMVTFILAILIFPTFNNIQAEEVDVHVSIYPIYEIAERIGGERLNIHQVTPDGVELHGYEPSPRVLGQLENTALFIYVGQRLQGWTENVADNLRAADIPVIDLTEHVNLIEYRGDHDHGHNGDEYGDDDHHDHEDEDDDYHGQDHGEYDNHIWLDFNNMIMIAELLVEEFSGLDPEGEEIYKANAEEVINDLEELDQAYKEGLQDLKQNTIIVSHAAFGYFAENYGLRQEAVTGLDPHSEPSSQTIRELIDLAQETGLEYIFLEVLASPRAVDVIAEEAGLEVLTLNPAAGLREEDIENNENYFTIMYNNLENLKEALK